MEITLNGKPHDANEDISVAGLVDSLEIKGRRVAVMINDEIVKRDRWSEVAVRKGDRVEVLHMVGGG